MLIEINDVWREYKVGRAAPVQALRGVTLGIEQAEFVALLGRSGSGKSTLMNLIGGLDRPTSGSIIVAGEKLGEMSSRKLSLYRRKRVGFVFQSFNLLPAFPAWENVAVPMAFAGVPRAERKRRALDLLGRVGLGERAGHKPGELSGGEQQRVAVARALSLEPALILADEPTGNLDSATSAQIMALIKDQHAHGVAVVMVTHDPDLATQYATRTVRMADGRVVEPVVAVPEAHP
ncbi:MAG: ABC transporter ATP-binding protein [Planctomycetes bacterium]|nr:ABC transporter ATP-binding protein [Planctomycetota bacterium]